MGAEKLNISKEKKENLEKFGITTRKQLIEAFNEPFNIGMFTLSIEKIKEKEIQSV